MFPSSDLKCAVFSQTPFIRSAQQAPIHLQNVYACDKKDWFYDVPHKLCLATLTKSLCDIGIQHSRRLPILFHRMTDMRKSSFIHSSEVGMLWCVSRLLPYKVTCVYFTYYFYFFHPFTIYIAFVQSAFYDHYSSPNTFFF